MQLRSTLLLAAPLLLTLGCRTEPPAPTPPNGVALGSLTVTSKSFTASREMPVDYSCDGQEKSPNLTWSSPPEGTKTFAVLLEDPDQSNVAFVHWIAFNVQGEARVLPEAANVNDLGASMGMNDYKRVQYNGPCPPSHEGHRYVFRVFALNTALDLSEGADKTALYSAMRGHVLAEGMLVGMFSH